MMRNYLVATAPIMLVMSGIACSAGPCSSDIASVQARIDASLDARAATGPMARESLSALRHHQPTPNSVATAERQVGDVSGKKEKIVAGAMVRARNADRADDWEACERALDEVRRAISP